MAEARRRAVRLLLSPPVLLALLVLLVNDQVLKPSVPWLAHGRASDVAWLLVTAPLTALAAAPLVRRRWVGWPGWIGFSCLLPAAVLVVVNTSEAGAALVVAGVRLLWPQTGVTVDPSDLWALPVLVWPAVRLVRPSTGTEPRWAPSRPVVLGVMGLAVLGATATSPCDEGSRGIAEVQVVDGSFWAHSPLGGWWVSTDGESWIATDDEPAIGVPSRCVAASCVAVTDRSVEVDGIAVWALTPGQALRVERARGRQRLR